MSENLQFDFCRLRFVVVLLITLAVVSCTNPPVQEAESRSKEAEQSELDEVAVVTQPEIRSSIQGKPRLMMPNELLFNVNKYAHVVGEASIEAISWFLAEKFGQLENRFETGKVDIDHLSKSTIRLRIHGIKGQVLEQYQYWEYLYVNVSLANLGTVDVFEGTHLNQERPNHSSQEYQQLLESLGMENDASRDNEPRQYNEYEVVLTMSGKFAAGGKPKEIKGYKDLITEGYESELQNYSSVLLEEIRTYLANRATQRVNLKYGTIEDI